MDPKAARKTARDAIWVIAAAFVAFPVVSAIAIGFDSLDIALIILGVFFFFVGLFAEMTGLA